jgi:hypothetical protein
MRSIENVYGHYPKSEKENQDFFLSDNHCRYFSLGRYALKAALEAIGTKPNDKILLPDFICRDLLASIQSIEAKAIFYRLDQELRPVDFPEGDFKAVIVVNYFGFPANLQDFNPFQNKCILIEDNAHGFLSQDVDGYWLGTRLDMGIFSIRKTLPLDQGAVFYSKKFSLIQSTPQLPYISQSQFSFKYFLRKIPSSIKPKIIIGLILLVRKIKKFFTGHEIKPTPIDSEFIIPGNPHSINLPIVFKKIDLLNIKHWRRDLYLYLREHLASLPITPLFSTLPENTVPYGYPFYCEKKDIHLVHQKLRNLGLECFPWPDLPEEVKTTINKKLRNVWMVRFLW